MDYTTATRVKLALGASETADDTLLGYIITAVSRAIDRHCAGMVNSNDYFKQETVTGEQGSGLATPDKGIYYLARKASVQSLSAFAYRLTPYADWIDIEPQYVTIDHGFALWAWKTGLYRGKVQVKLTYSGGLSATTDNLPADLLEAATVLAVRFYKEIKSGLGDTIGVAELGTLQYTKALPVRVVEMLKPYKRPI